MWQRVKDSQKLDVNSTYCYIMLSEYFTDTCLVAEIDKEIVGFVTSLIRPSNPEVLFVWQIAVSTEYQGKGIAYSLLRDLITGASCTQVRYIETTISPNNAASNRLFRKFAVEIDAPLLESEGFSSHLFPGDIHEDERLIQIGPINHKFGGINS
ncbi:diaminobutyrate acetyltransferase [Paenibacillus oryzisoli]|uniref:L-2,4-diaminobutyric acid acetyltransferase n=2 Tax=Paenibacillus oryzisoli TaxID=1850517 RepID=A0A198A3Q3_9BACL|nr:diaminobutyrate acetyltransferase [Paenibacillus oryzisoli]